MKKISIFMVSILSFTSFMFLIPIQTSSAITLSYKVVAKKTTITCYKGKITKKVTAISPRCPTSWTTKKPTIAPKPKPTTSSSSFISKNIPPATINTCATISDSGQAIYQLLNPFSLPSQPSDCDLYYSKATWKNSLLNPIPKNNINTATIIFCLPIVPPNTLQSLLNLEIYTGDATLAYLGKCLGKHIGKFSISYSPTIYWRATSILSAPTITSITQIDGYSVAINFAENYPLSAGSSIPYYLVKEASTVAISKIIPSNTKPNQVIYKGLSPNTTYQFSIAAVNSDGISPYSTVSDKITTSAPTASTVGVPSVLDNKSYGIDQKGPGGGTVFYYSEVAFTELGAACGSQCHYLEFAPLDWTPIIVKAWSSNYYVTSAGLLTIGGGLSNTKNMLLFDLAVNNPASLVLSYPGTNDSQGQWFIPSDSELALFSQSKIFNSMVLHGPGGRLDTWSSTDACQATSVPNTTTMAGCANYAINRDFGITGAGKQYYNKNLTLYILPVHAF